MEQPVPGSQGGQVPVPVRQEDPNAVSQYIENVKKAPEAAYIFMDMIIKVRVGSAWCNSGWARGVAFAQTRSMSAVYMENANPTWLVFLCFESLFIASAGAAPSTALARQAGHPTTLHMCRAWHLSTSSSAPASPIISSSTSWSPPSSWSQSSGTPRTLWAGD